jgi:hypothetical protein
MLAPPPPMAQELIEKGKKLEKEKVKLHLLKYIYLLS